VPQITATGFALLAQIAGGPSSAYDLTRLMRQNLDYLWPRAASRLYGEVASLEKAGLIRGRDEAVGRRVRRIMTVTAAGRRALREWIGRDVIAGIPLESEALLRVFFASWGSVADLRRALLQVQADSQAMLDVARSVGAAYLRGAGPAPDQLHIRAMTHELLSGYALLLSQWSASQLREISTWKNLKAQDKRERAKRRFEASMKKLGSTALPGPRAWKVRGTMS
jgi:PadR family transcriptional regulator, regulatory protein AphA